MRLQNIKIKIATNISWVTVFKTNKRTTTDLTKKIVCYKINAMLTHTGKSTHIPPIYWSMRPTEQKSCLCYLARLTCWGTMCHKNIYSVAGNFVPFVQQWLTSSRIESPSPKVWIPKKSYSLNQPS